MHRNPKTLMTLVVQVRNFYYLLEFTLSTRGERHTVFTMLTVPSDPTTHGTSSSPTGLASPRLKNQLTSSSIKSQLASPSFRSQLTAFFQNHQESQPIPSGHDVIRTPEFISYLVFLL